MDLFVSVGLRDQPHLDFVKSNKRKQSEIIGKTGVN